MPIIRSLLRSGPLLLVLLIPTSLYAQDTCTWNGGSGNWSDDNWSCSPAIPGAGDTATVSSGTVTLDSNVEIADFTLTATLDGDFDLTVTNQMDWNSGTQAGTGTTTIDTNAILNIANTGTANLNRLVINNGITNWTGTGGFQVDGGGTAPNAGFTNNGTFNVQSTRAFGNRSGLTNEFVNNGDFIKTSSSLTQMFAVFNSTGTVDVQTGTLAFENFASLDNSVSATSGVPTPAALSFRQGNQTLEAGLTTFEADQVVFVSGTNTVNVPPAIYNVPDTQITGGTTTFNGTGGIYNLPSLTITGTLMSGTDMTVADLTLTGTLNSDFDLTVTNQMDWNSGTQRGTGTTTIDTNAILNIANTGTANLNRLVINNGITNWTGTGGFQVDGGGTAPNAGFTNNGTFNVQSTRAFGNRSGLTNEFTNNGDFIKTSSSLTQMFAVFNSTGTVDVQTGTLAFENFASLDNSVSATSGVPTPAALSFRQGNQTLEAGLTTFEADQVVFVSGTNTVNVPPAIYNVPDTQVTGGTTTFNGTGGIYNLPSLTITGTLMSGTDMTVADLTLTGTLNSDFDLTVTNQMDWNSGTQRGTGTTTIDTNAILNIANTGTANLNRLVINNGITNWTGTGGFQVDGGGTAPNAGFTNNGTFNVQSTRAFGNRSGLTNEFINNGDFIKTSSSLTQMFAVFNSTGTVDVQTGTLAFENFASLDNSVSATSGVPTPAALSFRQGNQTLEAGLTTFEADQVVFVSGTNTVNVPPAIYNVPDTQVTGGTTTFNGTGGIYNLPSLTITGTLMSGTDMTVADLTLTGTLNSDFDLTVTNQMDWNSGTQRGTGTTTIDTNAILNIANTGTANLNRLVINNGITNWTGTGGFQVDGGGTAPNAGFTNNGTFNVQSTRAFGNRSGLTNVFTNTGDFIKTSSSLTDMYAVFNSTGTVDVQTGTLAFRNDSSFSNSLTAAETISFHGANQTLESGLTLNAFNVQITSGTTTIGANPATISNLTHSGGSLSFTGPLLTILGDFVGQSTVDMGSGIVSFAGTGTQNLTLNSPTNFGDLTVGDSSTLIETETADNAIINGVLLNQGIIRKSKAVAVGVNTFGLTEVAMDVTGLGFLTSVQVDSVNGTHPQAFTGTDTGRYWSIIPTGTGYTLDLTLVHDLSARDTFARACRYTGSQWDCDRTSSTVSTVTRNDVTELSDWAIGDERVFTDSFEDLPVPPGQIHGDTLFADNLEGASS